MNPRRVTYVVIDFSSRLSHATASIAAELSGIEVVRLVEGVAGPDAWALQATDTGLRSAATLLRRIHDAARTFEPPPGADWAVPAVPGESLTILHGDPGPWNMAWRGGLAVGLFDWDIARPGPALDDVVYALDYFLPLRSDEDCLRWHGFTAVPDRGARLLAFLDAYGIDIEVPDVVAAILARKRRTREEVIDLAARGIEPQRTWIAEGFLDKADTDPAWVEANITHFLP